MNKRFFVLYACCIPVKGFTRSLVCDVQRGSFKLIPNELEQILTKQHPCDVEAIKAHHAAGDHETLDEYFEFLTTHEYGFWTDHPERFPALDLTYQTASSITNAIIDVDQDSHHDYELIFDQLEFLGCKDLQIRCYAEVATKELEQMLRKLASRRIKSVELLLKYSNLYVEQYYQLPLQFGRLVSLVLHTSPKNRVIQSAQEGHCQIIELQQAISDETHCGQISPLYFSLNLPTFIEAKNHNSCLNRKISIDKAGNIKNCPSMTKSFGHVHEQSLLDIVQKEDFKKLWNISKDEVEICQDCEFRYICTDCRGYTKKGSGSSYGKPQKCTYDPYKGEWE
ncbi:grasp-with-spasm system SPASM domain peptide maturase [marine bacterium AO1-C]|nr:grasp-with-spasm system SPASM domain peptide maturase [marine bacterium AO1-C]